MTMNVSRLNVLFLSTLFLFPKVAFADSLSDLRNALMQLNNNAEVHATLKYTTKNQRDSSDDTTIKEGAVDIQIHFDSQGLRMQYSDEVMSRLEAESVKQVKDPDAETPTLMAVNSIDAVDVSRMLNATFGLTRLLDQATFIDESIERKNNKALRKLNFTLPLEILISDKQTRKYVSKFSNSFSVLIDDVGIPLESHLEFKGKGRAYIVIRVEASGETHSSYTVHEGRLLRTALTSINRWDSTFGSGEQVDTENIVSVK
jgi:hypothetical protein